MPDAHYAAGVGIVGVRRDPRSFFLAIATSPRRAKTGTGLGVYGSASAAPETRQARAEGIAPTLAQIETLILCPLLTGSPHSAFSANCGVKSRDPAVFSLRAAFEMEKSVERFAKFRPFVTFVIGPAAGAIGLWLLAEYPAVHAAICFGGR